VNKGGDGVEFVKYLIGLAVAGFVVISLIGFLQIGWRNFWG
jgi:hypothetical protein